MSVVANICRVFQKREVSWFTKRRLRLFFDLLSDARKLDEELGNPPCEDPLILQFIDQMDELDAGGYRGADAD